MWPFCFWTQELNRGDAEARKDKSHSPRRHGGTEKNRDAWFGSRFFSRVDLEPAVLLKKVAQPDHERTPLYLRGSSPDILADSRCGHRHSRSFDARQQSPDWLSGMVCLPAGWHRVARVVPWSSVRRHDDR